VSLQYLVGFCAARITGGQVIVSLL